MKILVIGDPHGSEKVKKIPTKKIDAIIIVGDIGKADTARMLAFKKVDNPNFKPTKDQEKKAHQEIYNSTINVLKYFSKIAPTYIIFGNVESTDAEIKKEAKKLRVELPLLESSIKKMENINLINNKKINLNGIKIGGLKYFIDNCWIKEFKSQDKKKISEAKKGSKIAKKVLKKFENIDILICHQPPYGILDKVGPTAPKKWRGKNAGSKIILNYIKKKQPLYVFCGHIHEKKGVKKIGKTKVYNVGCCGDYVIINLKD